MSLAGRLYGIGPRGSATAAPVLPYSGPIENLMPYGPDPVVFGAPKPMERETTLGGVRVRTCRACWVQWAGDGPCWCCGQP